ncbi:MAG: flagellar FliJ family protein [Bryobacteraceae bacterium]|nr:flagellar FliJ family protein [Bryobacteraceae bacterium]
MKKFRFPLERLRAWRRVQLDAEQSRMRALLDEEQRVASRREALGLEMERARAGFAGGAAIPAFELAALNQFSIHVESETQKLKNLQRQVRQAIEQQRETLLAVRRESEVLERLRRRRYEEWRAESDREEENLVAELVVARWKAAGR